MRIASTRHLVESLADAAEALLATTVAPTAPQIAAQRWPDEGGVAKFMLAEVRTRLPGIRSVLRDRGQIVVPVSERYYVLRNKSSVDDGQISECLAIGAGKNQTGILFVTDGDLLAKRIHVAHETWVHGTGMGKANATRQRAGLALDRGLITQGEALSITGESDLEIENDALLEIEHYED